jgi:hypothetical protein
MAQSVFDIVKAPLGWSILADNVKIGGVYGSKEAALEAAALAASFLVSDGAGVQINVPGHLEQKPNWLVAYETAISICQKPCVDDIALLGTGSEALRKERRPRLAR